MRLLPLILGFSLFSLSAPLASYSLAATSHQRASLGQVEKLMRYCNPKYDYCLSVPTFLMPQGEPPALDGQVFLSADKQAELRVWGQWDVLGQTLEESRKSAGKGKTVTYQQRLKNGYVLSGYSGKQIFYQITFLEAGRYRHLTLRYPVQAKAKFDQLIPVLIKSFVGSESPAWAGLWKFSEKDPKQSHYLWLKGSEAQPAGVYTGSESDEYLFYIKVGVSHLQISPEGRISFKIGPRPLFQTPQNPQTPPVIKSPVYAAWTGVEFKYEGQISGNQLTLRCTLGEKGIPGIDACWLPEMTFVKVKPQP